MYHKINVNYFVHDSKRVSQEHFWRSSLIWVQAATWAETDTLHEPMDDHNTAECERADMRFRSEAEDMCDSACPREVGSGSPTKDMRQHENLQRLPREDAMVSDPL